MQLIMERSVIVLFALACFFAWTSAEGISCSSCGEECADACGTRFFRTCCFNYLRKRSAPPIQNDVYENAYGTNQQLMDQLERIVNEITKHEHEPHKDGIRSTSSPINHRDIQTIYDI